MDQEKKNELNKKITAVMIILILFGLVYFLYLKAPVQNPENNARVVKNEKKSVPKKAEKKKAKLEVKKEQKKVKVSKIDKRYISPSSKQRLIRLASANVGKQDPFYNPYYKEEVSDDLMSENLPSAEDFLQRLKEQQEEISLKGFIGKKAIIKYQGTSKALSKDEIFRDIQIKDINTSNLTVEYIKHGKIDKKNIKTINNKDLKILEKITDEPVVRILRLEQPTHTRQSNPIASIESYNQ